MLLRLVLEWSIVISILVTLQAYVFEFMIP